MPAADSSQLTPDDFQKVRQIFEAALDLPAAQRASFVKTACAGSAELRAQVERMLAEAEETAFLDATGWQAFPELLEDGGEVRPGLQVGPYAVEALLGAGGMGNVWKALDTRVGRRVAIKFTAQRLSYRFEREGKAIALLNHPNICTLYDVGPNYLVMELVEGRTLQELIERGPVPLKDVLEIGRQVAAALEYAHERRVIHRDLKPANVKVTPEGSVKVLDFGLAEIIGDPSEGEPASSASSTLESGLIAGTPAYVPPELLEGKAADRRADIWAFGVMLIELLTGMPLFTGTRQEILTAVAAGRPSLDRLPSETPPFLRRLIERCLDKDPSRRLRDIGEARVLLEDVPPEDPQPALAPRWRSRPGTLASAGVLVSFLLAVLLIAWLRFEGASDRREIRLSITLPTNSIVGFLALSPDARRVAVALLEDKVRIWLRSMDSPQMDALAGTENARSPFWSPDGRYLGFFADGSLKTIAVNGGPPHALCEAGLGMGGSWSTKGVILAATQFPGTLLRVDPRGGPCTRLPQNEPQLVHAFPAFLPDGFHFLYGLGGGNPAKMGVYLASLDEPSGRMLLSDTVSAVFAPDLPATRYGNILFARGTQLLAQRFDTRMLRLEGEPVKISDDASPSFTPQQAAVSAANGVITYLANRNTDRHAIWVNRSGNQLEEAGPVRQQRGMALSPNGKSVLFTLPFAIWVRDLLRKVETRVVRVPENSAPVWSPDGRRLVFTRNGDLYAKEATVDAQEQLILHNESVKRASDWSRDGKFILYTEDNQKSRASIWFVEVNARGPKKPEKFHAPEGIETQGQFSPDGKWVAYTSDESGRNEVYIRPFPPRPGQWKVSVSGGREPRWNRDGEELFYIESVARSMRVNSVKVQRDGRGLLQLSEPKRLFEFPAVGILVQLNIFSYSPHPDGERFLVNAEAASPAPPTLNVIVNWQGGPRASSFR